MKIITWANLKGGTGKSLLTMNVSGAISFDKRGKRVLVIDGDPQGNVTNNFAIDRLADGVSTIVDVFENNISAREVIVKTVIPNVSIIMGSLNLTATELKIINVAGRELILKNWINDNKDFLEANFDYIFIDTPPSFNIVCQNFFIVSDAILLCNDFSMNSVEGSEQFCALWRAIRLQLRLGDNVEGFIINNFVGKLGIANDCLDYIKRHPEFSNMLFNTVISNSVALKQTELDGVPIHYLKPKPVKKQAIDKAKEEIESLKDELIQRGIL